MRKKTKQGIDDHILNLKMTDEYLLLGDSHVERLIWKFPHLAPPNTWLCGIGGDRAFQLSYRIYNENGNGYAQHQSVRNEFKRIGILIGTNDILPKRMNEEKLSNIVKEVERMYGNLRRRWPNAEIKVFPIPPVPLVGRKQRSEANIDDYNQKLMASGMVKSGDCFAWNLNLEEDFEDHVHLTESGYLKVTKQIIEELL